jgi:hypothetical protein
MCQSGAIGARGKYAFKKKMPLATGWGASGKFEMGETVAGNPS